MKHTDTKNKDHNLEFLITMSKHAERGQLYVDPADRRDEIKKIVDNLNEFYAEHGRMPNATELDVTLGAGGKNEGPKELTYDLDDQA
jgi:hypothetical protein